MHKSKPRLEKETWEGVLRFIWISFSIPLSIIAIAVPFVVDKLCGHIWGVVAAVANIILWLSFGLKSRVSPGLMMLWLAALVYVIIVAVVEFGRLFHWHL